MNSIKIYDPAMCCSSGVCGPSIDPELLRVATVINKLDKKGISIQRYNLNHSPQAFVKNRLVQQILKQEGVNILPITLVNDQVVKKGAYLTNEEFCKYLELSSSVLNDDCCNEDSTCCNGEDGCCNSGCC